LVESFLVGAAVITVSVPRTTALTDAFTASNAVSMVAFAVVVVVAAAVVVG